MKKHLQNPRIWCLLVLLASLAVVFHASLLQLATWPVADNDARPSAATHLLFLRSARGCKPAFQYAAEFTQADSNRRVLVMQDYVRRAEAIGAEPSFVQDTIAMLTERGVAAEQIEVIGDGDVMLGREKIALATNWLGSQPESVELVIATKTFNTGFLTRTMARTVPHTLRSRMHLLGFDRGGISVANWWRSAAGVKEFIRSHLRLIHLFLFGEIRPNIDWDPDEYERTLRAQQHAA